jgi:hypothetical protein
VHNFILGDQGLADLDGPGVYFVDVALLLFLTEILHRGLNFLSELVRVISGEDQAGCTSSGHCLLHVVSIDRLIRTHTISICILLHILNGKVLICLAIRPLYESQYDNDSEKSLVIYH